MSRTVEEHSELLTTVRARAHVGAGKRGPLDATALLSLYAVLLLALPSSMYINGLNSLGRPSVLFGLALLLWWLLDQLSRNVAPAHHVHQPLRIALFGFLVVALVSYAFALLRGQPADQVSPATVSLETLLSLAGVTLVALDGITTLDGLRALIGRMVMLGSAIGALGLAQFATGRAFVDMIVIPGMSGNVASVQSRDSFLRAAGTSSHPLEYAAVLCTCLPLAIALALDHALSPLRRRLAWCGVIVMAAAAAVSVSRSALVGVALAVLLVIPALPSRLRRVFLIGAVGMIAAIGVLVPGMLSTMFSMFAGISNDSSAQSRSNGLAAGIHFVTHSPWVGLGFGTFLPRYYILDDEWMLIAIQLGILGLLGFAAVFATGMFSAYSARHGVHADNEARTYGQALIAAIGGCAMLCASFDALSFAQSAGLFFLLPGLAGALRRIYRGEAPPVIWSYRDTKALRRYVTRAAQPRKAIL
ncbi:O-antigen ligase family protein [Gryllotalpicola koreensis]|uniref:O-antigen ligase-related domain-containing protein n=1 Tax=Gryllotalpicola koreensis TaxID=993086 RepID=A0ABP7ZPD2_9MICO